MDAGWTWVVGTAGRYQGVRVGTTGMCGWVGTRRCHKGIEWDTVTKIGEHFVTFFKIALVAKALRIDLTSHKQKESKSLFDSISILIITRIKKKSKDKAFFDSILLSKRNKKVSLTAF